MRTIITFTGIGFFLLLAVTNINVSPLEHSGQHVTPSMVSMANLKDNKTWLEDGKIDPISISISPAPTWSSTLPNSPHSTTTATTTTATTTKARINIHKPDHESLVSPPTALSLPPFGSIPTKTPSAMQKTSSHHHEHHKLLHGSSGSSSGSGKSIESSNNNFLRDRKSFSSRETIIEVKRSADEFEFQLESPNPPPMSLASSSTRITGPYFESNKTTVHLTARAGQTVLLDCAVILLQGRTVSWLRRRKDNLQLLTVGNATYYSDSRVGLRFRYPNNWRLGIDMVQKKDEGEYHCQLSTHPTKALIFHLKVIAPAVQILDENGHVVTERHYKVDSSLHLTCKASNVDIAKSVDNILWLKGANPLPGGDSRIKVKLSKSQGSGEATGYLSVLSVRKGDSGNYTCVSGRASSTISVHVLNGELLYELQHESTANSRMVLGSQLSPLVWILASLSLLISTLCPTALHMGSHHQHHRHFLS